MCGASHIWRIKMAAASSSFPTLPCYLPAVFRFSWLSLLLGNTRLKVRWPCGNVYLHSRWVCFDARGKKWYVFRESVLVWSYVHSWWWFITILSLPIHCTIYSRVSPKFSRGQNAINGGTVLKPGLTASYKGPSWLHHRGTVSTGTTPKNCTGRWTIPLLAHGKIHSATQLSTRSSPIWTTQSSSWMAVRQSLPKNTGCK